LQGKLLTIVLSFAAVVGLSLAAPTGSAFAAASASDIGPLFASCGTTVPDLDTGHENVVDPARTAANQRSGSSTSCAILGVLQTSDNADYYCWTSSNDGFTWTYLRNIRTGVRGWVRDDLLKDGGSFVWCGI
jgi:hypothetical protein